MLDILIPETEDTILVQGTNWGGTWLPLLPGDHEFKYYDGAANAFSYLFKPLPGQEDDVADAEIATVVVWLSDEGEYERVLIRCDSGVCINGEDQGVIASLDFVDETEKTPEEVQRELLEGLKSSLAQQQGDNGDDVESVLDGLLPAAETPFESVFAGFVLDPSEYEVDDTENFSPIRKQRAIIRGDGQYFTIDAIHIAATTGQNATRDAFAMWFPSQDGSRLYVKKKLFDQTFRLPEVDGYQVEYTVPMLDSVEGSPKVAPAPQDLKAQRRGVSLAFGQSEVTRFNVRLMEEDEEEGTHEMYLLTVSLEFQEKIYDPKLARERARQRLSDEEAYRLAENAKEREALREAEKKKRKKGEKKRKKGGNKKVKVS